RDRPWERVRPRGSREVVEAQPEHDGSTGTARPAHASGDAVDQRNDDRVDGIRRTRWTAERALRPDRASSPAHLHGPGVTVVGERVEVAAGRAPEHRDERPLVEARDFADGGDAAVLELAGRDRPDAPQSSDRQRVQEVELALR